MFKNVYTGNYPNSCRSAVPPREEIASERVWETLCAAEAMARKKFYGNSDIVADAVSIAWETAIDEKNLENGTPGSIANFAVKKAYARRHFHESQKCVFHHNPPNRDRTTLKKFDDDISSSDAAPLDLIAADLDFHSWIESISARQREVALLLLDGHTTEEIAEMSDCTPNGVRMMRMRLKESYQKFIETADQRSAR